MEIKNINIDSVSLAEYNPRKITNDKINMLVESIMNVGFVIPVIYNTNNNVLLAGHQRIKASKMIGLESVPAIGVNIKNKDKEINFNIIHNTLDNSKDSASRRRNIEDIIDKYGNVFFTVMNESGEILYGYDYYQIEDIEKNIVVIEDKYSDYFKTNYGKYDYSSFTGYDFNQHRAQMSRAETLRSQLYTRFVEPYMNSHKNHSVLDFGSGKGFEARRMNDNGFDFTELEFYHKEGEAKTFEMMNKVLDRNKLFDDIVIDSVLNSVTKKEYQEYLVQIANAFIPVGGHLFISSRSANFYHSRLAKNKKDNGKSKNTIYSTDDNDFSVTFKGGLPFFQKFDYKNDIIKLANENGFKLVNSFEHTSFYLEFEKTKDIDYTKAIEEEFSLPKASGGNYNFSEDVINLLTKLRNNL